jgi:hypothetical protein
MNQNLHHIIDTIDSKIINRNVSPAKNNNHLFDINSKDN